MIGAIAPAGAGMWASTRRFGWRTWMVLRVPLCAVVCPVVGVLLLIYLVMCAWLLAMPVFAGGAIVGLAIGLVATYVFGAEATDSYAGIGGAVAVAVAVLGYSGAGVREIVRMLRKRSLGSRARGVVEATAAEWREAADRWPARRRRACAAAAAARARHQEEVDRAADAIESAEEPPSEASVVVVPAAPPPIPVDLSPIACTTPIVAWRGWNIGFEPAGPFSRQPVLSSFGVSDTWDAASITATCRRVVGRVHGPGDRVPHVACTCGIHAVKQPELVPSYGGDLVVFGAVELTGRVIEARRGYRAERARIIGPLTAVFHCGAHQCRVAPVTILITATDAMPACETHRGWYQKSDAYPIEDFAAQLRARLELRYGVDVEITKGARQWT